MTRRYWIHLGSLLVAGCWTVLVCAGCDRGKPAEGQGKRPGAGQTEATRDADGASSEGTIELPEAINKPVREAPLAQPERSSEASRPGPAGTQPAAPSVPPWQPLLDAKPGEWVEYETLDGRRIKYEVLTVAPSGIQTQISIQEAGRSWGEPATRDENAHDDPLAKQVERHEASRSVKSESIKAAGHDWQATLYEDRWTDEEVQYIRRTWVSNEVPYHGIIRMELTGDGQVEARLGLVAYGKK